MTVQAFTIEVYVMASGYSPFRNWLNSLNLPIKARIQARIFRFENGNLGDYKSVGNGVFEARFDFGPGYRVYFSLHGSTMILLLVGGDKASQRKDICNAQEYLSDYKENNDNG